MDHDPPAADERPSRSARRREALDVLALAKRLAGLSAARLDQLELPEDVRGQLGEIQRTPSHIAHKREVAHLAKVMRAHGDDAFATARARLANDKAAGAREAAALHATESLRERLLGEAGDAALTAFITAHPGADRQRLRALIRQARRERETGRPPRAQRELFRVLHDIEALAAATPVDP